MHNIKYVDKIKIITYLKVLQHVSDHRRSIIREPCTVLGYKLQATCLHFWCDQLTSLTMILNDTNMQ